MDPLIPYKCEAIHLFRSRLGTDISRAEPMNFSMFSREFLAVLVVCTLGGCVIYLCLGAYRKPIFLVLHLKIKSFPMFSITIDLVGKYRTQATARRRSRERTLSWTNWLVQ